MIDQCVGHLSRSMEVERHGFLALILAHMQILERSRTASVIHQNIDPTEPGNGRRSKLFRCVFFVQVSGDDHRTMTAFRHNFFGKFTQFVDSAGRHGDADTLGRRCQRDATSDSHAGPGDECSFVVKFQVHGGLWGGLTVAGNTKFSCTKLDRSSIHSYTKGGFGGSLDAKRAPRHHLASWTWSRVARRANAALSTR